MNPTTDQLPPPPPPLQQPPRSSFSCDRHPNESFNGFCPLCLCERLTTLDNNNQSATTSNSSRRNSTSSAIKSIFKNKLSTTLAANTNKTSSYFFPELRRTKSFSATRNAELTSGFEPQRKSCDVRNSLFSLFSIENKQPSLNTTTDIITINKLQDQQQQVDINGSEIRNIVDEIAEISEEINAQEEQQQQQEKREGDAEEVVVFQDLKTMKDHIHIDLDSNSKKSTTRSNFWSAASVLSKKWQKWRRKQKKSPENDVVSSSTLPVKKPVSRETQSEIADYGFGRRSCDVDPRFSLDAGRVSFDDPRYSFDEPRASWDGYLIGRTFPRLPPMVEDVPVVVHVHPRPPDMQISSVEEEHVVKNDEFVPGGSVQTREYYTDSSSKRRKSLDRSNSIRKMAAAVVAEMDQTKENTAAAANVSNAKVTPATIDYGYPNRGLRFPSIGGERELGRDSNSNSLRDDCSETFELGLNGGGEKKELGKKPRRWRWKLWGFIQRRGSSNKDDDDDDGFSRVNGVERSYSESWQESGIDKKVFRSNSSVSWRNSSKKSSSEINGFGNGKNRRVGGDEFVLERNRSARYSPKHTDSGLLRFYLTPLRGSRRSRSTSNSNSVAKNMLRPY